MKLAVLFSILLTSFGRVFAATPIEALAQKWVARYNGPSGMDDFSSVVAIDSASNVYTAGYTMDAQGYASVVLVKHDGSTGARKWEWMGANRIFGDNARTPGYMRLRTRLLIGADGNPVLLHVHGISKVRAADGVILWTSDPIRHDGYGGLYYSMRRDSAGDIFACGTDEYGGVAWKLSEATGAKVWERRISREGNLESVVVDFDGNVIVSGSDWDKATHRDGLYIAKYAGSDGAVIWERHLTVPFKLLSARLLTLDSLGGVIVVTSNNLILKYTTADGQLQWQQQGVDSPYEGTESPYDVLCDPMGDIYVAHSISTIEGARGATLSKYRGTDGSLRWSKSGGPEFYCSLLLRGDEVLVAGQRSDDLLLAAFDSVTGGRRWDATYGLLTMRDRMTNTNRPWGRIALQPDGGVVITGCSQGASTGYDFATLRFAPGPTVKAAGAKWVLESSARLSTMAAGNGQLATVVWEYGPTETYGTTTEPLEVTGANVLRPFETTITGLPENTTFHARAVITSVVGITYGEDFVFTTGWDANGNQLRDQWELAKWGNTIQRSATADDDRDGMSNLLEYALGQNPLVPNPPGSVPITPVGDYLTATITKQPFVTYTVEASHDLQAWNTSDTIVMVDDTTTLVVRGNLPISGGGPQFLRIRATAQ